MVETSHTIVDAETTTTRRGECAAGVSWEAEQPQHPRRARTENSPVESWSQETHNKRGGVEGKAQQDNQESKTVPTAEETLKKEPERAATSRAVQVCRS